MEIVFIHAVQLHILHGLMNKSANETGNNISIGQLIFTIFFIVCFSIQFISFSRIAWSLQNETIVLIFRKLFVV